MKPLSRIGLLLLLALLLNGCATIRPQAPEVSLLSLQLDNLTLSHAIMS
ncbi:MAG: hypothetical protein R2864_10535 [Syntrophotaleaceae bacterium]